MNINHGQHHSESLPNGIEVHLIRHPGELEWQFNSADHSWIDGSRLMLWTHQLFARDVSWGVAKFPSIEGAIQFIERRLRLVASA
jgi:hypothetical protein